MNRILAIESSCDETGAAVIIDGVTLLSSAVSTSTHLFASFGGVVPEVAAREQVRFIIPTINKALHDASITLNDIDAFAVTVGPGLIGPLLVGVESAKTLAYTTGKPIIPINHVHAHLYANMLVHNPHDILFPAIGLVVSGGHTELFLLESLTHLRWMGGTLDDAAGEAFDKTARLLGFQNRGGRAIQEAALLHTTGRSKTLTLPRPLLSRDSLNFSFSGLKTAVLRAWRDVEHTEKMQHLFSWELQETVTDVLVTKAFSAVAHTNAKSILLAGGVAANTRLNEKLRARALKENVLIFSPPPELCTDNAAMIGACAHFIGSATPWQSVNAQPNVDVERMLHET